LLLSLDCLLLSLDCLLLCLDWYVGIKRIVGS